MTGLRAMPGRDHHNGASPSLAFPLFFGINQSWQFATSWPDSSTFIAIFGPPTGKALLLNAHYDSIPVGPGAATSRRPIQCVAR